MLNLVQVQEKLKGVPAQALMQYANGANPQIPPFLALGELNRRKKMQESAAAEQAQAMEGAPSIKDQIEQATGLMALQGNRQRQAAQQQAQAQQGMPMPAPNTTTSEPAQMAGGGFIDDIVVPRDYAPGGIVQGVDPEVLKSAMFKEAMRGDIADIPKELLGVARRAALRRAPGISNLQLPKDMFKRADYAGGGIVAFDGTTNGSYVKTNPLEEDEETKAEIARMSPEARMLLRGIKQLQQRATPEAIAARRQAMGLPTLASELPDTGAKTLEELQRQQREFQESDTMANRILALTPGRRFGYGETGKGLLAYEKERAAKGSELGKAIASAQDLREKAKLDFAEGRFKESETGMAAADKAALDAQKAMMEMQKGRELATAAKTIFDEAQAAGTPISMEEAYRRATLATTRPPDRYTALSNRLIAANREFKDRAFFLEQQLNNAKSEAERAKIQKSIMDLRTQIMESHSITPADLAELQRLDRSSGGAGGTGGGSSAGKSDPLGIR